MTVDRIEPIDKKRCKVFLNGEFAFALYRGELRRYQIEEGEELPEAVVREIMDTVVCRRARERSLYLLKFSSRTEGELRRKLQSGWYPEEAVEYAVSFLKRYHYLDDREYVRNYLEVHSGRKSRAELTQTLMRKGVDRELIRELSEESAPDSEEAIKRLLKKRGYDPGQASPELRRKTIAYLMRRGFPYEEIRHQIGCLEEME